MKLYVPSLGDDLLLIEDWQFIMESKHIEYSLLDYLYGPHPWWAGQQKLDREVITLTKGTVLRVERIYIRKGCKDYDSITFRICKTKEKLGCRFWVPLKIANTISFELV